MNYTLYYYKFNIYSIIFVLIIINSMYIQTNKNVFVYIIMYKIVKSKQIKIKLN